MEVPTNKTDILKLFDKMNKDSDGTGRLDWPMSHTHHTHGSLELTIHWD